jgi:hypothetical protein
MGHGQKVMVVYPIREPERQGDLWVRRTAITLLTLRRRRGSIGWHIVTGVLRLVVVCSNLVRTADGCGYSQFPEGKSARIEGSSDCSLHSIYLLHLALAVVVCSILANKTEEFESE